MEGNLAASSRYLSTEYESRPKPTQMEIVAEDHNEIMKMMKMAGMVNTVGGSVSLLHIPHKTCMLSQRVSPCVCHPRKMG